jgi:cellulose synthase/poly-beta-1,6-N-acetylglucosamine synthase-like glycosyltransferase/peptidoglycan/xylan/chitin deacetylase (PgdA/CDA1 family)
VSHGRQVNDAPVPVFYDRNEGRRWKVIRVTAIALVVILVASLAVLVRSALQSPATPPETASGSKPVPLSELDAGKMPLFGDGVYQRIVEIERGSDHGVASDVFTGEIVEHLSPAELRVVGAARYAFQRYGVLPDKQLALTFDDGPDRTWTPKILDLLSRYRVQASFFVVGGAVAKDPALTRRIAREGHLLGNHTFTHPEGWPTGGTRDGIEMALTDRVIRAATGRATELFRNPYAGNDTATVRESLSAIYTAQRLGYQTVAYDLDTKDWQFEAGDPEPAPLDLSDGRGHVVLLHDGGGDRELTYAYLERTIKQARRLGYAFTTPRWIADDAANVYRPVRPSVTDRATLIVARGVFGWVEYTLLFLFVLGLVSMIGLAILNVCLASASERRRRRQPVPAHAGPVTVAIAAYNEETVVERTIESVLRSTGVELEVLIVNDGSKDGTREILDRLAHDDPRVRVFHVANGGKGNALNLAFRKARNDRVVTFDADTIVPPDTVARLVRHLDQRRVAGVAGLIKVGNVRGVLTAWQSLEYVSSIGVERTAQSVLGTITVVPGACAAFRRRAVLAVGGFTTDTLAEDCDLTLKLQRAGFKVIQDNTALAFTEAPQGLRPLLKQRFRWSFGNLQALWKHRSMMFRLRHGLLGMVVLPYTIVSLVLPIVFLPFLYTALATSALAGGSRTILIFAAAFTLWQGVICCCGVLITRSSLWHMLVVPLFRVISEPLRVYLLYKSWLAALRGREHGWNKLTRTGTVELEPVLTTHRSGGATAGRGAHAATTAAAAQAENVLGALMPTDKTVLATTGSSASPDRQSIAGN